MVMAMVVAYLYMSHNLMMEFQLTLEVKLKLRVLFKSWTKENVQILI